MAVTDEQEYGRRTVTGVAPPPPPPYYLAAPGQPSQPPPQATLYPAALPPPPQPQVVDRVAYLQEQRNRAAQAMQAIQPLQEAIETYSEYGKLARERGGYEPGSYANPATEAYARTQFEQGVPREMGGLGILETLNKPIPYAQDVIGEIAQTPERLGRAVDTALAYATNRRLGETGSERVQRATQTEGTLTEAGRELEPVTRLAAEVLIPQRVWELAVELSPLGTVADLRAAFKEGVPAAIKAVREAAEQTGETQLVRRLASETGALGGKGEPEDILAASVRAEDAGSGTPALTTDNPLPSPVQGVIDEPLRYGFGAAAHRAPFGGGIDPVAEALTRQSRSPLDKLIEGVKTAQKRVGAEQAAQGAARGSRSKQIGEAFGATEGGFESTRAAGRAAAGPLTEGEIVFREGMEFTTADADFLLRMVRDSDKIPAHYNLTRLATQRALIKLLGFSKEGERIGSRLLNRSEIKALEQVFGPEVGRSLLDLKGRNWGEEVLDLLNLQRSFITAWDFSMPFRQSLFLTVAHPKESFPAMAAMMRSAFSDKFAKHIDDTMRTADDFGQYLEDGNFFASPFEEATELTNREELFATRFAQKVPGVRRSQQAALTYLNKLQYDVWRTVTKNSENWTPKHRQDVASVLNHMRGRGTIPKALEDLAPALNWGFFSPRLLISRFQVPLDVLLKTGPARKLVARDIAITAATGMGVLTLGKQLGAWDVQLNPYHPDFGKGKVGKMRFDFWGGEQQLFRYVAQLIMQKRSFTGPFGTETTPQSWQDTFVRFLQSKASPQLGFGIDILKGEDFQGDPVDLSKDSLKRQAWNRLVPLFIQDVTDATREYGPMGFVGALPSAFGISVQTYETTGERRKAIIDAARPALTQEELTALDNGVIPNAIRDLPEWQEVQKDIEEKNAELQQRNQAIRDAGAQLESGEITAEQYRQIVGDVRASYRAVIEALDLPDREGVITDYFAQTYDRATINGVLDQDALDTYITEWEQSASPEAREAVRQLNLAADDPKERELRAARQQLAEGGFYDRRKEAWAEYQSQASRSGLPQEIKDALAGMTSPDDLRRWAQERAVAQGYGKENFDKLAEWKAWDSISGDVNGQWLVENPELDVLALIWGYQTRVHSQAAADLYEAQTGLKAPVPSR